MAWMRGSSQSRESSMTGWDGMGGEVRLINRREGKEIGRREEIGNRTEDLSFSCGLQCEPYVVSAHCNTVLVRPSAGLLQVLLGTRGFSSQVLQHLNPLAHCPCAVMPHAHRSSRSGTPGETCHTPTRWTNAVRYIPKTACNVRQSGFSILFTYVLEVYRPVGSHYGDRVLTP